MATQPTSKKVGTKFPVQQPIKFTRTEAGSSSEVPFETTDENEWAKEVLLANISGTQYEAQSGWGKHSITNKYPYNFTIDPVTEPPVNLWEKISTKVQKSILDSNNPLANSILSGEMFILSQYIDNVQSFLMGWDNKTFIAGNVPPLVGTPYYPQYVGALPAGCVAGSQVLTVNSNSAILLAQLIASGVTSFDVFAPTLRFTMTVNPFYPIVTSSLNVGTVISTNSMYYLAGVPANLLFSLPNFADPTPADGSKPILHYGWYKNDPEVRQIAKLKNQIVFNYEYGLWPEALYGVPL